MATGANAEGRNSKDLAKDIERASMFFSCNNVAKASLDAMFRRAQVLYEIMPFGETVSPLY
jgi:hypothetical protein